LYRETTIKPGQLAHLDHNNQNDSEDNLAFLRLTHHDEYDSKTSQRKGFAEAEVKHFRTELYEAIDREFSILVHFGEVKVPPKDPYAGHYIRTVGPDESSAAEIMLTPIPDGFFEDPRYAVTGMAFWGGHRPIGPNMGDVAFIATVRNGVMEHVVPKIPDPEHPHTIRLTFSGNTLSVEEENCTPFTPEPENPLG
jgi:hypothetical protein